MKPKTATATAPASNPSNPAPFVPNLLGAGTDNAPAPTLRERPAFVYVWHPDRWGVVAGAVVPLLGQVWLRGGVNRCRALPNGMFDARASIADRVLQGWKEIPFAVDGPGTSYLVNPAPGIFLSRWETAHAGSDVVSSDVKGYVAWLRSLVDRGLISRPKPYVLDRMRHDLNATILALTDKLATTPSVKPLIKEREAELAAVEAELAHVLPVPVDAPPVAPPLA